jgi:hypothetical protein
VIDNNRSFGPDGRRACQARPELLPVHGLIDPRQLVARGRLAVAVAELAPQLEHARELGARRLIGALHDVDARQRVARGRLALAVAELATQVEQARELGARRLPGALLEVNARQRLARGRLALAVAELATQVECAGELGRAGS